MPGGRVPQQATVVMRRIDDGKELERELLGIGLASEVTLRHRELDGTRQCAAQVPLGGDQRVAHGTGPVVVFGRRADDDAAPGHGRIVGPGEPAPKKLAEPRQAARGCEGRGEDEALEALAGVLQRRELEIFLRAEVGKQATLGHSKPRSERTDSKTLEPVFARKRYGLTENVVPGLLSFSHGAKIARTFGLMQDLSHDHRK